MDFHEFNEEMYLQQVWNSVEIARSIPYTLFTFGVSDLEYYLVLTPEESGEPVKIRKGEIQISRPLIMTPGNATPELEDFFESDENDQLVQFLMARSASFSNLKLTNLSG